MQFRKVRIDEKRAEIVFKILNDAWAKHDEIFKNILLPEERYPIAGGKFEQTHWLFYASLTQRGGIISEDPFKLLLSLREVHPDLFIPKRVAKRWTKEKIFFAMQGALERAFPEKAKKNDRGYKLREHAGSWHKNSMVIAERYDGDARNIFAHCRDFEEAFARIDYKREKHYWFAGMRRKIFSLMTIWLQKAELIPVFPTPIPIDFHAIRILVATGVVDLSRVLKPYEADPADPKSPQSLHGKMFVHIKEDIMDEIAVWSQGFMARYGFSHLNVNPALWVLGRDFCAEHPQNQTKEKGQKLLFPEDLKRDSSLWPKRYKDPCGYCPVECFCTLVAPSSTYYLFSGLFPSERVSYPSPRLRFVEFGDLRYSPRKKTREERAQRYGKVLFSAPRPR